MFNIGLSTFIGISTAYSSYYTIGYIKDQRDYRKISETRNKLHKMVEGKIMDPAKSKEFKKEFKKYNINRNVAKTCIIIAIITAAVVALVAGLRKYSNEKFNMTDYDSNEKEIQSQIDKINKQISKAGDNQELISHLNKLKNEYFALLVQLRTMKKAYDSYGKKGL